MWPVFVLVVVIIAIVAILACLIVKAFCTKKDRDHVSLRFPLPPPTGDSDSMDETQYDYRIKTLRNPKESTEGSGDVDGDEKNGNQPNALPSIVTNKSKEPTNDGNAAQKNKGFSFLFEAPPPYEETEGISSTLSGERRRMVSIRLPDLLTRRAADSRVIELVHPKPTSSARSSSLSLKSSEARRPSTSSSAWSTQSLNAASATPVTSITQLTSSATSPPMVPPNLQAPCWVALPSVITSIPTGPMQTINDNQRRKGPGSTAVESKMTTPITVTNDPSHDASLKKSDERREEKMMIAVMQRNGILPKRERCPGQKQLKSSISR